MCCGCIVQLAKNFTVPPYANPVGAAASIGCYRCCALRRRGGISRSGDGQAEDVYWGTVFYKGQESANRLLCSSKIRIECTVPGFAPCRVSPWQLTTEWRVLADMAGFICHLRCY